MDSANLDDGESMVLKTGEVMRRTWEAIRRPTVLLANDNIRSPSGMMFTISDGHSDGFGGVYGGSSVVWEML